MAASNLFSEMKRRQIYRGGVMYVVAGWVIVQVATTLFPIFNIPDWAIRLVVVVIMLGFPLALVALWMFESNSAHGNKEVAASTPPPAAATTERRRGADRSGDALAQIMESERVERQRANEELIAALDRLHHTQHGAHESATAAAATAAPAVSAPVEAPRTRRSRVGVIFIGTFVSILAAWIIWILVAPSASVDATTADPGKLTHEYVMPAYRQAEQLGAALLEPLLRKLGIHISPDRVFTALMLVIALLVLRNLYRSMVASRRLRHQSMR